MWGRHEPLPPIIAGLMFMVSSRAKLTSTLTQSIAAAVATNAHLGPILLKLSSSSSRWSPALLDFTKQSGKFPVSSVRAGIAGSISRIPELTLKSVD